MGKTLLLHRVKDDFCSFFDLSEDFLLSLRSDVGLQSDDTIGSIIIFIVIQILLSTAKLF